MNYTTFKESIVAAIRGKLTAEESIMEHKMFKTNMVLDAITLKSEGSTVSPTIYPRDMYADYMRDVTRGTDKISEIADRALLFMHKKTLVSGEDLNTEELFCRENIQIKLVNTRANEEYLKTLPHRETLDLSIVYYVSIKINDGNGSITITNALAEKHGYSEEMLYNIAIENLKNSGETRVSSISNLFPVCDVGMYVIYNESRLFGSRAVLLPEELLKLADIFGGDFLLLPSSVHDWIAVPYANEIEAFTEMVYEVNRFQVSPQERLSNNVYRYNSAVGAIEILYDSDKPLVDEMEV